MTNERHEKALEAAEWVEHDGVSIPDDPKVMIDIKFRDGRIQERTWVDAWVDVDGDSEASNWNHSQPTLADIMFWRIHNPNHFTNGE